MCRGDNARLLHLPATGSKDVSGALMSETCILRAVDHRECREERRCPPETPRTAKALDGLFCRLGSIADAARFPLLPVTSGVDHQRVEGGGMRLRRRMARTSAMRPQSSPFSATAQVTHLA